MEASIADAPIHERHWPPDNPNTVKSRLRRAQAKENRRDPIYYFSVPLKRSAYNQLIADFEREHPLAASNASLDDDRWRDAVGKIVIPTMLKRQKK